MTSHHYPASPCYTPDTPSAPSAPTPYTIPIYVEYKEPPGANDRMTKFFSESPEEVRVK